MVVMNTWVVEMTTEHRSPRSDQMARVQTLHTYGASAPPQHTDTVNPRRFANVLLELGPHTLVGLDESVEDLTRLLGVIH